VKVSELRAQRHISRYSSWVCLLALSVQSTTAQAQANPSPASLCVAQAEHAQEFYQAGDVAQARAEVALCAQAHCPPLVRDDCQLWLQEWDQPVASNHPVPAESSATPEPSHPPTDAVTLEPTSTTTPVEPVSETQPAYNPPPPVWPWVASAVAAAGGAGFAYWGLSGRRDAATLADECGHNKSCRRAQVDPVHRTLIFADVSLGVGIIAAGAAIWGFATGSTHEQSPTNSGGTGRASSVAQARSSIEFSGSSFTARFVF
jgi:hypothetical protein